MKGYKMKKILISVVAALTLSATGISHAKNEFENKTAYTVVVSYNKNGQFEVGPHEKIEFSGNEVNNLQATVRVPVKDIPAGSNKAPIEKIEAQRDGEVTGTGTWVLSERSAKKNKTAFVISKK